MSGLVAIYLLGTVAVAVTPANGDMIEYTTAVKAVSALDNTSNGTLVGCTALAGAGAFLGALEHVLHEHSVHQYHFGKVA